MKKSPTTGKSPISLVTYMCLHSTVAGQFFFGGGRGGATWKLKFSFLKLLQMHPTISYMFGTLVLLLFSLRLSKIIAPPAFL